MIDLPSPEHSLFHDKNGLPEAYLNSLASGHSSQLFEARSIPQLLGEGGESQQISSFLVDFSFPLRRVTCCCSNAGLDPVPFEVEGIRLSRGHSIFHLEMESSTVIGSDTGVELGAFGKFLFPLLFSPPSKPS